MLKRRVHRLIGVYTCQNATLLEITCHGINVYMFVLLQAYIFFISINVTFLFITRNDVFSSNLPVYSVVVNVTDNFLLCFARQLGNVFNYQSFHKRSCIAERHSEIDTF